MTPVGHLRIVASIARTAPSHGDRRRLPSGRDGLGGGAGGGGGGVVILVYYVLTGPGTIRAAGGARGTAPGGAPATDGADGSAGKVIQLAMS